MSPRVALVTCLELPEVDIDAAPLAIALQDAGVEVTHAAWDDPKVDWARFDACVVRATWNYPREFTRWHTTIWKPGRSFWCRSARARKACFTKPSSTEDGAPAVSVPDDVGAPYQAVVARTGGRAAA